MRWIEPLDVSRHDREAFFSGVSAVDNFLKRTARKLAAANNIRVFVLTEATAKVIGFYAINAYALGHTALPSAFARSRPGHGNIPAAYISMMGVDRLFAGQGF